jgi:hypothetical protein
MLLAAVSFSPKGWDHVTAQGNALGDIVDADLWLCTVFV